jgi:hypothetical protein
MRMAPGAWPEALHPLFAESGVDLKSLRLLEDSDLAKLGVLLAHRRALLKAITELKNSSEAALIVQPIQEKPPARESVSQEAERRQLLRRWQHAGEGDEQVRAGTGQ